MPPTPLADRTYGADFAAYYDLITSHKDYRWEADVLARMIEASVRRVPPRVLDIGCGTGSHTALLAARGYDVTAIDESPEMARRASAKAPSAAVSVGEIATLAAGEFDFAAALFNVVNYLESLEALVAFANEIAARLIERGCVIVEAWNPIAVAAAPPETVVRTYETAEGQITRTVVPRPDFLRQRLDLDYEIARPGAGALRVTHRLVLFSPLEIGFALRQAGFTDVRIRTALPDLTDAGVSDRMLAFTAVRGDGPA
jgi:SAM-dependent methyltransferase